MPEPNQLPLSNSAESTAGFLLESDRVEAWSAGQTNAFLAVTHVAVRLDGGIQRDILRLGVLKRACTHVAAARTLAGQDPRWWVGLNCGWATSVLAHASGHKKGDGALI